MLEHHHFDGAVVPPAGVQLLRLLGAGAYGNLYVGRFEDDEGRRQAFIKVLIDAPGPEVDRLLQIEHVNLVGLRAVVMGTDVRQPPCLVYDCLSDAVDLHQYLVLRRMRQDAGHVEEADDAAGQWRADVADQVARGLDYLASMGLVHRDVAARNVVIAGHRPTAKLADFSLSRYPYADDYFRFTDGASAGMPLPLRWLAPEALFSGRYSEASDVWAYGVLLWEMYCGQALTRPFEHLTDDQLIEALAGTTGRRPTLPCIRGCPTFVYALMTECWKDIAVRRPRFNIILDRLEQTSPGREVSPSGSTDSGVTVVASMSGSPQIGTCSRASSFRSPQWPATRQTFWDSTPTRRPFSPVGSRQCPPRQMATGSPLAPRSNSPAGVDTRSFNVVM